MGKDYENFYENMQECQYRLNNTTVMYDGEPYMVIAITSRRGDKIFRVYLMPLISAHGYINRTIRGIYMMNEYGPGTIEQGEAIDKFMETEEGKKVGVLRKHINSPKFNKFRPFPLGMINKDGKTYYMERSPQRIRDQGLTIQNVQQTMISLASPEYRVPARCQFHLVGEEMRSCMLGQHPSLRECIETMKDPTVLNEAVAFHRECALVRAPLDIFFLAVKGDIVGLISEDRTVTLAHKFRYLKEMLENTNAFIEVRTKAN